MNCGGGAPFRARLPFATAFPPGLPYNGPVGRKGGGARDGGLSGQRVCPQRPHGLSFDALRRPAGGNSPPAEAVCPGGIAGRRLRRGGVPAGTGLSRHSAGKAGHRDLAGPRRLRRGGEAAAADAAVLRRLLRHGRVCAGSGAAGGRRRPHGRRRLLYGRGRPGPADRRRGGLHGAVGGVPGRGPPRRPGRTGSGAAVYPGAGDCVHGPPRYGKQPPGSSHRRAGAGCGTKPAGHCAAGRTQGGADGGGLAAPGCSPGTADGDAPDPAAPSGALPVRGGVRWTAAGSPQRLGRDRGGAARRTDRGPVPHGTGDGIQRPVGRSSWKEREP